MTTDMFESESWEIIDHYMTMIQQLNTQNQYISRTQNEVYEKIMQLLRNARSSPLPSWDRSRLSTTNSRSERSSDPPIVSNYNNFRRAYRDNENDNGRRSSSQNNRSNTRSGTNNDKDIFLIKYDENGNKLWSRQEGTDSEDIAYGVAVDSLDNLYVTGKTCSNLNANIQKGNCDYFLIKYNSSGTNLWTKQGGSSSLDVGKAVGVDSSDFIYIAGYTYGNIDGKTNLGGTDYFIVKYNRDGYKQ